MELIGWLLSISSDLKTESSRIESGLKEVSILQTYLGNYLLQCMAMCDIKGLIINQMSSFKKKNEIEYRTNKAISMMRRKSPPSDVEMSKKLISWRPSWIDNGYLISLYSISIICTIFCTFITKKTIDTPIVIIYHFLTMQTGSRNLQFIP